MPYLSMFFGGTQCGTVVEQVEQYIIIKEKHND
jgi:hypothetical protein